MADTDRDGISTLYHALAAPTNSDSNSTTNEPDRQKRTRSQLNVPDLILRLPLSRSPLKDARKARTKARGISETLRVDSQLHTPGTPQSSTAERGESVAGSNVEMETGTQEAAHRAGEEEDMDTCADGRAQQYEEEEGTEDSLFSPASHGGKGHSEDSNSKRSQHALRPTRTKERPSPDADAMRALSGSGSQRQSKRAKVEAFRILGRGQEHSEYHEPLRDPDASTPGQSEGYQRASSTGPTPFPSRVASSIFPPRAQSVPLGGEKEIRALDFTSIPSSPQRLPGKGRVEIRRAPSVPPPDSDRMDVDLGDTSALLQFTNPTHLHTPRPNPVFRYTVNFATPSGPATLPHSGLPSASPLSPLTPLPPSPFTERLPKMQSLLAKVCPLHAEGTSGFTGAGVETKTSRETSGRSLTTLSHALDKLVVPPPSRPNTSMGFVRADVASEESTPENGKGKWKAKDDASLPLVSTAQGSGTTFARPTASSLKRAATVTGFRSKGATRIPGRGGAAVGGLGKGRGTVGIFGKARDRASKKTSLPVVAGSPVKGSGGTGEVGRDGWGAGKLKSRLSLGGAKDAGGLTGEEDMFESQDVVMQDVSAESSIGGGGHAAFPKLSLPAGANASNNTIGLTTEPVSADKGKQRAMPSSTLNPASSALHALSESLSSLPQTTPPKPRAVGTRAGLRSSTAGADKGSPALDGSGSVGPGGNSEVHGSTGAGPSNGTVNGSGGVKISSFKILKRCAIFVDVRTEQGDDAGSLFIDMLKGLGAKIMGRLGQTCTHIVYKNGLPNTITRYRMLNDPKPVVVGIAWVVECAEKRARVDEEQFKIDVDVINVAGGNNKRRRSMLPKHLIPISPGPGYEMSMHMSSEADDDDEGALGGIDGSPSQDPDVSIRSREEDDLPPLERARKRRSILPGGQTRLVS